MSVKVVVTSLRRYWCAGRCWEAGETEAVLEDLPGLSVEQQLAQLDGAKGGVVLEQNGLERSNPEQRSPAVLTYRIVLDEHAHETLAELLAKTPNPCCGKPGPNRMYGPGAENGPTCHCGQPAAYEAGVCLDCGKALGLRPPDGFFVESAPTSQTEPPAPGPTTTTEPPPAS